MWRGSWRGIWIQWLLLVCRYQTGPGPFGVAPLGSDALSVDAMVLRAGRAALSGGSSVCLRFDPDKQSDSGGGGGVAVFNRYERSEDRSRRVFWRWHSWMVCSGDKPFLWLV